VSALSERDIDALGQYNAEVARGIAHTPEWRERMAELQTRFDAERRAMASTPIAIAFQADMRRLNHLCEPIVQSLADAMRRLAAATRR
jgi:hypothetical protein